MGSCLLHDSLLLYLFCSVFCNDLDANTRLFFRSAMRTLALLVPILGVTWVVGVIAFAHDSIVIQYIFAICNAFQVMQFCRMFDKDNTLVIGGNLPLKCWANMCPALL